VSHITLRGWYLYLLYGGLLFLLGGLIVRPNGDDMFSAITLILPGAVAMVASTVCGCILLYRSWRCVAVYTARFDTKKAPMDPAGAVVLAVVPLINIIGIFFSWGRLPQELNWLAKAAGVEERAPKDLGIAAAAVVLCSVIPVLGLLFGLVAGLVLVPLLMVSCSRVAEAIETRLSASANPADSPHLIPEGVHISESEKASR
jgi:hypothetical protein